MANPKIIHRIYFENFAPFHDPYEHYLETWYREMPDYKVMKWGYKDLDVEENEWTRTAARNKAPVFLSEYFRWKVLSEYGGLYLDADCEILNGRVLSGLLDALWAQDGYDAFCGVEERESGHPTAQTVAAKKGAGIIEFMRGLYVDRLAPFWTWRESRGLIGPQLMSLFFAEEANPKQDGFFRDLDTPIVRNRTMVYPQHYFSPKYTILGSTIDHREGETCVYHMFANSNIDFSSNKKLNGAREKVLTYDEYRAALQESLIFPRTYDSSHFLTDNGVHTASGITATKDRGLVFYGPYFDIERGRYTAKLKFSTLSKTGTCVVRLLRAGGTVCMAEGSFNLARHKSTELAVDFEIEAQVERLVEVTLSISGIESLDFNRLVVERVGDAPAPLKVPALPNRRSSSLKLLHRVYFGFDGKEDGYQRYLETWREQLPDFEILHWDASNLPMDINPYVKKLHKERDHAFLTDYFRWYLLREYGGSYLDADVEITNGAIYRRLVEELGSQNDIEAFIGIDEKSGGWYTAHSMASKPGSDIATFMCSVYEDLNGFTAWRKKGFYFWAPQLTALYFANRGHNVAGMGTSPGLDYPIVVSGVKIYPQEWFAPLAPTGRPEQPFKLDALTENTSLCHHFACSWHESDSIYLAHAKDHGGQSNVLLRELAERETVLRIASSDDRMKTAVGAKTDGGISAGGTGGCLSYGPYMALNAGKYRATFRCGGIKRLGRSTIDVVRGSGKIWVRDPVKAESVQEGSNFTVDFVLPEGATDVECRFHVSRWSKLAVRSLEVRSLSE